MDSFELKEYIKENNLYTEVLKFVGCHSFKESTKNFIRASLEGKSNLSIGLHKPTLKVKDHGNTNLSGDIYSLIMELKNITFSETIVELHNLFNLKYTGFKNKSKKSNRVDCFSLFKKIRKKSFNSYDEGQEEMRKYSDNIINNYIPNLHITWAKDMLERTRSKFDIGFSIRDQRITVPHRHYETGEILGVIGRTVNELYEELEIAKYYPLIKYSKGRNIYGLFENYSSIQKVGRVVVYEAEKSVHKRHARFDETGVAIGSHNISDHQVKILKKLDVEIVIAFDKDVKLLDILKNCDKFYPISNVSFIYDKEGILNKKDSPADANMKNYEKLFNSRKKYNQRAHDLYVKMLERGKNGKKR